MRRGAETDLTIMTISDYHIVMSSIGIAELKARLSEHLRKVRRGESLTVLDRQTPIARIVPHGRGQGLLHIRKPAAGTPPPSQVPLPPSPAVDVDVVELLLEDRGKR
ncbi:MAG: type II toxin-antitoxin system prevent-host-death family antitoxin [Acidobacteria bacterium]|nr:MAG: type II toxin-antitoxin system prevent-host-death family antitoxin [Acidobacteriota bacterium]